VTLRWPLIGSLVALIMGAGLAALVLAFCGGGEEGPSVVRSPTRTPSSRTVTVTRTPKGGTPVATGTPTRTVSTSTPEENTATPSSGEPPEETPQPPPPPPPNETETPEPQATLPLAGTPLPPSPTSPAGTSTAVSGTATPKPTPSPTPGGPLPDLVLLNIFVSNDRLGVILGNQGTGELPAGQEVDFLVRGVVTETETLTQALPPGTSTSIVMDDQVIYSPELVLAVVDPNNLIAEEDDGNNGFAKQVTPDIALDLGVHGVFRAADTNRLLVVIQNSTSAPAIQVTVQVTVYLAGATEPTTKATYQLTIEPQGFDTVEVPGVAALAGTPVKVLAEMTEPPDANPANNVWEGTLS
jgi:hypothetical protein